MIIITNRKEGIEVTATFWLETSQSQHSCGFA